MRFGNTSIAKIAQLVERDLAKVEVAGSSPVARYKRIPIEVFPYLT